MLLTLIEDWVAINPREEKQNTVDFGPPELEVGKGLITGQVENLKVAKPETWSRIRSEQWQ